jgi:HK97 family phage major capsid protein
MSTSAGWAPESLRTGRLVLSAQEQPMVVDLMPMTETEYAAVKYMEETTFTNNAAEAAEGGQYGEAALALTERSVTIEKIAVWLPVTDEELEDVKRLRDYINNRLYLMLKQRLDSQLVAGNGATPNILGILNKPSILTQAKGSDPGPDAIYKGIVQVRVTGKAFASGVLMHPNDWQEIRLLRTADGIYIWGNPADGGPERIWGLPVVLSTNETENTAVVGDFRGYAELCYRRGITVRVSDSHSDFFIKGKQAIRADFRCASIWRRAAAFCQVTGL